MTRFEQDFQRILVAKDLIDDDQLANKRASHIYESCRGVEHLPGNKEKENDRRSGR